MNPPRDYQLGWLWESVAGMLCSPWGGTAKYSPVFILPVTCFTCRTLSEGSVASISGKKGCSASESVFVVSQMSQTISGRDPGDHSCWDQTWDLLEPCCLWGLLGIH